MGSKGPWWTALVSRSEWIGEVSALTVDWVSMNAWKKLVVPPSTYLNSEFLWSSDDCRTAGGRSSDGRRRRPCRQRRGKKKHLIEASPFGRLDQMLGTIK